MWTPIELADFCNANDCEAVITGDDMMAEVVNADGLHVCWIDLA